MSQTLALDTQGIHNSNLKASTDRLIQGSTYQDLSVVVVTPTRDGKLDHRFEASRDGILTPMNQPAQKLVVANCEVADAYNQALAMILAHPQLSKWRFFATLESDNLVPPDGLLKLLGAMTHSPYAGIGGVYWTKGEGGQPMIYGAPFEHPVNFRPQVPMGGEVIQECRGIAQGFTVFDMALFKDKRLGPPWFKTVQEWDPNAGVRAGTQDLEFCGRAIALGYRFAVHNGVKVGHLDFESGIVW